ncbi:MAG: GPW/gp25 family protein [Marinisporobacter sp.]|jgi:phage baseplate assembly protein W|nr:GPW/gp25 family protein [Marinisporobacter sp.]
MGTNGSKDFLGRGWKFPVQVDKSTGRIMLSEHEEDIKEAIRIIISTYKGERVMRGDFGSRAKDFVFDTNDLGQLTMMQKEIEEAIHEWEPRIYNLEVEVVADYEDSSRVFVNISYIVRSTNNGYNMVYPFYLFEGLARVEDI